MAVRIRMKKMGRTHRPFYRVCAIDGRRPRDGKVIEELGHYDPMVKDTDARAVLNGERIDYWLGVGAQPSDKVSVLIKKYGTNGTHLDKQRQALERLKLRPQAPEPVSIPRNETPVAQTPASEQSEATAAAASDEAPVEKASAEESSAEPAANDTANTESKEEPSETPSDS